MSDEYGGYLPLELRSGSEYYSSDEVIRLNSARAAVRYAVKDSLAKVVWLPYYLCNTVYDALKNDNVVIKFYNIDKNFFPTIDFPKEDLILWPNYFGIMNQEIIFQLHEQHINIIFDNTQAFYSKPMMDCYNVYSCRKFFGVCDGAYLIKDSVRKIDLPQDKSYLRATHLLRSIDEDTNSAYIDHLQNENAIGYEVYEMSKLTSRILESIDYSRIRQKRLENYQCLHSILGGYNQLLVPKTADAVAYPFFYKNEVLRINLIQKNIYVPQWWKCVIENEHSSKWEKELSQYLLPLPIDQRYGINDMNNLASIIVDLLN